MTDTAAPLHRRIYADIEAGILSGALRPGQRIPAEHELTVRYGCSRMTVSKAVSELAGHGLVVRRKGAGSFVAAPPAHAAVLSIPDLAAEVANRGMAYGYRLLERSERTATTGEERDLAQDGRLLDLTCLHLADGRPLALERRLISLATAPGAARADFSGTPPGAWLLQSAPWTQAEHRIAAVEASPADSRLLGVRPGAACLRIRRRTWRDGRGVTRVSQLFSGDRYDLVARFAPGRSGETGSTG